MTVDPSARKVEIGLGYVSTLVTTRPEVATGAGSSLPAKLRWAEVAVKVSDTVGLTIRGTDPIPFRRAGDPSGESVPLFSGLKRLSLLGWEGCDGQIMIQQTQPLPAILLAVTGTLDLGGA